MKRIEIIIPHRKLEDAHEILKGVNTGGMSYYTVEGSGKIKAERITVGKRYCSDTTRLYSKN